MKQVNAVMLLLSLFSASAGGAAAGQPGAPRDYGKVVIENHSADAGIAPVVFNHWVHRARYTCRLCHVDIGFAMAKGATDITAATNRKGWHCGACHDGKRKDNNRTIFSSCRETTRPGEASCERCHAPAGDNAQERDFTAFVRTMPHYAVGNGIDWVAAERRGIIKPVDFLEGISIRRQPLKAQKDFSFDVKAAGVPDVVFSHKKHAVWNGCEVCHPDIFPIKRGVLKYTMRDMEGGKYCGACHDKVAFPLLDCRGCHPGMKK